MSDMQNEVNSHVQNTKSILKNFENESRELYYLDLNSNKIEISNSKKLGTIKGYYYLHIENFLHKKVENGIGNIFKDVSDFAENKKREIIIKNIDKVKKYVEYSIIRGKKYLEYVKEKIDNKQDILDKWLHNIIIENHIENEIFDDYKTTLFINKTNVKFITLSNTIYAFCENNINWIVLPITPLVCIAFSKNYNNVIKKKQTSDVLLYECKHEDIIDSNIIERMNKSAFVAELFTSNNFIAGDSVELKKWQKYNENIGHT